VVAHIEELRIEHEGQELPVHWLLYAVEALESYLAVARGHMSWFAEDG
jgi:hypothetical protein